MNQIFQMLNAILVVIFINMELMAQKTSMYHFVRLLQEENPEKLYKLAQKFDAWAEKK